MPLPQDTLQGTPSRPLLRILHVSPVLFASSPRTTQFKGPMSATAGPSAVVERAPEALRVGKQRPGFLSFEEADVPTSCLSFKGCFHSGAIRAEGDVFSPPEENCTVCVCLVSNLGFATTCFLNLWGLSGRGTGWMLKTDFSLEGSLLWGFGSKTIELEKVIRSIQALANGRGRHLLCV